MPWPAEPFEHEPTRARLPRRHLRALVSCDAVADELPLVVDGSRCLTPAVADHLAGCLRCQAELAAYRRILRLLRSLREEPVTLGKVGAAMVAGMSADRDDSEVARAGSRALVVAARTIGVAVLGGGALAAAVVLSSRRVRAAVTTAS